MITTTALMFATAMQSAQIALVANAACASVPMVERSPRVTVGGQGYVATVHWTEGAPTACVALLIDDGHAMRVLHAGAMRAGWSARYQSFIAAPSLGAPAIRTGVGGAVWIDASVEAMGHGGGGGAERNLWTWDQDQWRSVLAYTPLTMIDVNDWQSPPQCRHRGALVLSRNADRATAYDCMLDRRRNRAIERRLQYRWAGTRYELSSPP